MKLQIKKGHVYRTQSGHPVMINAVRDGAWGIIGEFIGAQPVGTGGILQRWNDCYAGIVWTQDQSLLKFNLTTEIYKEDNPEYFV